jgi:hypothetical protein
VEVIERILLAFFVFVLTAHPGITAAPAKNQASPGILRLRSLAGVWEGRDERGNPTKTTFKLIAGDTAVMETLSVSRMEEMVTIYSQDGDDIMLLHYCPTNNQPRMRATPAPGDVRELVFAFEGASNLADASEGHEQRLVIQFQDNDHITERWTWRQGGKDTEMVYHFARKNRNSR